MRKSRKRELSVYYEDSFANVENTRHNVKIIDSQHTFRRLATEIQEDSFKCILKLSHHWRTKWDLSVMVLSLYNSFSIPFVVSFAPDVPLVLFIIDTFIDFLFLLDIFLNFRTSYIDSSTGEEVNNPSLIAKRYILSGRLLLDFMSTFPFYLLGDVLGVSSKTLDLFSMLKLVRLIRLSKIVLNMRTKEDVKLTMRFLQFLAFLMIYLHLGACSWHYIVALSETWSPISIDSDYYSLSIWGKYIFSLYFSTGMLVGFELSPQSTSETLFVASMIITGSIVTAVLFGEMILILGILNRGLRHFERVSDHLNTTMKNLKLPQSLQYEVSDYLVSTQNTLAQQEQYKAFKEMISPSFRAKVNKVLFRKLLRTTCIFSENLEATGHMIKYTENMFFKPDENIVTQFEESTCMYFLLIGAVEVIVEDLNGEFKKVRKLESGDFFGEIGVLFKRPRTATITVAQYATVAQLPSDVLIDALERFPGIAESLKERAGQIYKDPLSKSIDKLMHKVMYIANTNSEQYTSLTYSVYQEEFNPGHVLLNYGDFAQKIMFLVKGNVSSEFKIHCKDSHFCMKKLQYEEKRLSRALSNLYIEAPCYDSTDIGFDLFLHEYCAPSILCADQALVKVASPIRLTTQTYCKLLILKTEALEKTALSIKGTLKTDISILRTKYCEIHPRTEEQIPCAPILDALQVNMEPKKKQLLKFKRAVLKLVMKNRIRKQTVNLYDIVKRLIALAQSEGLSWKELKLRVDSGMVPTSAFDIQQILKENNTKNDIKRQMALIAVDNQNYAKKIVKKLKTFDRQLEKIDNSIIGNHIDAINTLFDDLEKLIIK